ncbi:MAG TPA: hypothetical protein VHN39_14165 [Phenylobacterium sp.]|jgi:hypothetical protein|nr:hypothetical protein [Phenylobacterium sp.]
MRTALAFAMALSAVASMAHAEPVFDAFQKLCLETNGARTQALSTAEAQGWQAVPQSFLSGFSSKNDATGNVTDVDGRAHSEAGGLTFLVVAHADRIAPKAMVPADLCVVGRAPGDIEALKAAAAGYAAVPGDSALVDEKGVVGFAWRTEKDAHVALAAKDVQDAAAHHNASVLIAGGQGRIATVALAVPAK